MRYPQAYWAPGPPEKQGYTGRTVNVVNGAVLHSMVGQYAGALSRLNGPDRASWHFSVLQNGDVFQHYDTAAICWHAGVMSVNVEYVGIEHEGGGPSNVREPLTPEQLAASLNLVRWLSDTHDFPMNRSHMREHNEFYSTACPSGRIPWACYTEEEDMKPLLVWNLDKPGVYLIGPFGSAWITQADDVAKLEVIYGKMAVALHDSTIRAIGA